MQPLPKHMSMRYAAKNMGEPHKPASVYGLVVSKKHVTGDQMLNGMFKDSRKRYGRLHELKYSDFL